MGMPFFYHAWADPVETAHRACHQDDDCALIAIGCLLPCVGHGTTDAVNKTYASQYKYLASCTRDEIKRASEIGCASVITPTAVCEAGQCKVRMIKAR